MEMAESETSENRPRMFPVTQWTVILAAGGTPSLESAAALERLCSSYWYPLYAFVRRSGHSPSDDSISVIVLSLQPQFDNFLGGF